MKIMLIAILILSLFLSVQFSSAEEEYSIEQVLGKAKVFYFEGLYRKCIGILEEYFLDDRLYELGLEYTDPIVEEGRNMLGDCYRLIGRFDLARNTFLMSVEQNPYETQASYNNSIYWFLYPMDFRDGLTVDKPKGYSNEGSSRYSIFQYMIAVLDWHDHRKNPDLRTTAKEILNWMNIEKLGWLRVLLIWYSGIDVDLDELAEELNDDAKARLYFYAGLKYEIEDDWKNAKAWYEKSVGQKVAKVFEVDVAKSRLGKFDIDPDGHFYAESSSALVERVSGNLAKHRVFNLFDNNPATAWVPDNPAPLEEWFSINLYEEEYVEQVKIINGYAKSEVLFKKNCRAKVLRLRFSDGFEQRLVLKDSMEPQYFRIDRKVKAIKVFVDEIIKGDQYRDLCISEFMLYFKQ